jgi:quinolinate synthase
MDRQSEILQLKTEWGGRLLILAHYYQREEVFRLADISGDSYQLALAASRARAEHIVFCGVFFMASSARILARDNQRVYLPDFEAGCPLADMAGVEEVRQALAALMDQFKGKIVPVVYINSSAEVKALVADAGGITCTSSNSALLVQSFLNEGKSVFFLPDKNLGLNTARLLGLPRSEVAVYRRHGKGEPVSSESRLIVWDGFCNVHVRFSLADVRKAKNLYPSARILVHPECPEEVVEAADYTGSTSGIIKEYEKAGAGEVLFIGTELNLVLRLAGLRPEVKVFPLRSSGCVNMNKITIEKLGSAIRAISSPPSPYEVFVDNNIREKAIRSLQGMIDRVEKERIRP